MRLICGLVRLDGAQVDPADLAAMASALTSPGLKPRLAQRVDGSAALAVLDFAASSALGAERLPQSPDGTWLAADVRLDRPAALAASLGRPLGTDAGNLVLAALARWGKELPDRVDGDFALAAWNPERHRLVCARDIMGGRPLCYTHRPGRFFAFASLPRGLHASGLVPLRPDPIALGRLLVEFNARAEPTGFEEIAWLRAGHSLELTPQGLHLYRAWRPEPAEVGRWRGSAAEAAAMLRELVEEAVACRLPQSGAVAAHLSGGLDSSAVTVIAARHLRRQGRRLHAYSQLASPFPGPAPRDEREFVQAVLAQEPDIDWTPVHLPPLDSDGALDPDLPLSGPLAAPDDWICAAAAGAGTHLLLSGAGGDEGATYNGAGLDFALLRQGRWRSLASELRAKARREERSLARVAASRLLFPLLPECLATFYGRLRGLPSPHDRRSALDFLAPPLAARVAAALAPRPDWCNRPQDRVEMLTDSYLVGRATRWAILGARHGIAFTYPLADRRIIDFALSLPLERFLDAGFSRQPYRNAMAGILPESIRWRDSKFLPFPDLPARLAAALPGLQSRLQELRRCPATAGRFDLEAIAAAFSTAREKASLQPGESMADGRCRFTPELFRALDAMQALTLAQYLRRLA